MLTQKQISEIRGHLEQAQNPVFFFDNDQDGLCSYLLLQRYIGRGRGVPIKSFPSLTKEYMRKVIELSADYIFILDKPIVSKEFFEEVEKINLPIVWIDHHHSSDFYVPDWVAYYNPVKKSSKEIMATTAFCWQIVEKQRREDLWLAVVGCISDNYLPDFYSEFAKAEPGLVIDSKNALEVLYKSQIGKIARLFGFGLKDRITNVINMVKFLMKVKSPYDVLEENSKNKTMHERFDFIDKKYQKFLEKARELAENNEDKLLFFQYGGGMSISSDLANGIKAEFPEKVVVVVYVAGIKANVSVRGNNIKEVVLRAIEGLDGATAGGHEDAVGAVVRIDDLEEFRRRIEEGIK